VVDAVGLNADAHSALINRDALGAAISAQGTEFKNAITDAHAHLFADVAVFVTREQVKQMQAVIAAVEEGVTFLPSVRGVPVRGRPWLYGAFAPTAHAQPVEPQALQLYTLRQAGEATSHLTKSVNYADQVIGYQGERSNEQSELGVFYGYDFHLNVQGVHLIEINTNAGGAFLNGLLIDSQCGAGLRGKVVADERLEQVFLDMFRNEWQLVRGDAPLKVVAIVDEQPESQYLYPEFLLAKAMFERAGITTYIVDPSALQAREEGLYVGEQKIDLIYNRLTDFSLQQFPHIRHAHKKQQVVLTPNPSHYQGYADKRKLAWLTDTVLMRFSGVPQGNIDVLLQGIPQTKLVTATDAEQWWAERKQWFFKPVNGYGSKGAYRGDKITKRVFEEIMNGDYVAQKLAVPGERNVSLDDEVVSLKYDVRCYVYEGRIQLIAARLYQGQTTNFRTSGGGFAAVRVVE
jgi:hypothetical protein